MSIYKRMAKEVKPHWHHLSIAVICMLVVAGTTAGLAYLMGPVVDDIFVAGVTDPERARRMIIILPIALVAVMWIKGGATYSQTVLMVMVGQRIVADLRERIYAHLQELPLSFYDNTQTGLLIARMTNDVNLLRESVSSALAASFRDIFTIIGLIALVFYRDWRLAIIAMVVFPLAMVPFVKFGQWVRRISTRNQQATAEMANHMTETITGARVVKAFTAEKHETSRFREISQRILRLQLKEERVRALSSPTMESLGAIAFAVILGYGGHRVLTGAASAGTFVSFIAAVIMLYDPLKKLARTWTIVQRGVAAADRIYELLDTRAGVEDSPEARELTEFRESIQYQGVRFSYGREPVLKSIDLDIRAGMIVALAGSSGGGKTTLVNLLPRFYDLEEGRILIDGTDIRDLTQKSLRRMIGLVTQQIILFDDTIKANIAYGRPGATDEEIVEAAKAAYAHDFITELPHGYETLIGEQGVRLSGGQRQRLAIARALLKDAPILILDEATSSLDTESEYYVQKAIDNLMKGRTTLVIAHRLSTIYNAHRIVVVSGGRIVQEGRHEELLNQEGEYRRLYEMQFKSDN